MKKTEAPAFGEFMTREAQRYGRAITVGEIETWFETFKRTPLEEFKLSWEQHRKDAKRGVYFPTINDLMRLLRVAGDDAVARDWRCVSQVGEERCGYPGAINVGGGGVCCAHYKIIGTAQFTEAASLQIIEQSRDYVPPKTPMEAMERGAEQRAAEGERWRKSHAALYEQMKSTRQARDEIRMIVPAKPAEAPYPELEADPFRDANEAAALAAQERT